MNVGQCRLQEHRPRDCKDEEKERRTVLVLARTGCAAPLTGVYEPTLEMCSCGVASRQVDALVVKLNDDKIKLTALTEADNGTSHRQKEQMSACG